MKIERSRPGRLARYDRLTLIISMVAMTLVCWWYLVDMVADMALMPAMPEMSMVAQPWNLPHFMMMFAMWAIMMVAMMVPTALRAILIFARVGQRGAEQSSSSGHGFWFALGYVVAWTGFSLGATMLQWGLDQAQLLSRQMVLVSPYLGAGMLVLAGLWQMSPIKDVCLKHCQSPMMFMVRHFHPGRIGAVNIGLRHGLYCLGCCWVLMGLLFVGGVMNLLWIAIITAFVLVEKLCPPNVWWTKLSGLLMTLLGGAYLVL